MKSSYSLEDFKNYLQEVKSEKEKNYNEFKTELYGYFAFLSIVLWYVIHRVLVSVLVSVSVADIDITILRPNIFLILLMLFCWLLNFHLVLRVVKKKMLDLDTSSSAIKKYVDNFIHSQFVIGLCNVELDNDNIEDLETKCETIEQQLFNEVIIHYNKSSS